MKNILDYLKNIFTTKKGRAYFLFLVPFLITMTFFLVVSSGTSNVIEVTSQKDNPISTQQDLEGVQLIDYVSQFSQLVKLPLLFLNFNMFVKNNVISQNEKWESTSMLLNVTISGKYTGGIRTGDSRVVYRNIHISKISTLTYQRSLDFANPAFINSSQNIFPKSGSNFVVYMFPNLSSVFLFWFCSVVLWYGFIVLFGLFLKFILLGSPIKEILHEYQGKKGL